eukprot:6190733-Pleurochrysis_carterae.AAC.2
MTQRVPEGTWVLQEYIMNPMTYKGHKFDLRIWAVVTSLDPLRMHLLKTGIPKVCVCVREREREREIARGMESERQQVRQRGGVGKARKAADARVNEREGGDRCVCEREGGRRQMRV